MPGTPTILRRNSLSTTGSSPVYYDGMPEPTLNSRMYVGAGTVTSPVDAFDLITQLNVIVNAFPEATEQELYVYDDSVEVTFYAPETPEQLAERIACFHRARENARERRRQQYEELRAEFEGEQ